MSRFKSQPQLQKQSSLKNVKQKSVSKKGAAGFFLSLALVASSSMAVPFVVASANECNTCITYQGQHIVKKGETMYSIAKMHGVLVEQLMDANFTYDTKIIVGQKLMIPKTDQPWHGSMEDFSNRTYQVVKGDTLYSISKRTGVSVDSIKKLNQLTSDTIRIGQYLTIRPDNGVRETKHASYTVKSGDTKYSLRNKFGNTIQLPSGELNILEKLPIHGQVMHITTEEPFGLADGRVIEVKSGKEYYPINVYQGNQAIEYLAYRNDLRLTFTVVRVGERNELISYAVQYLK